MPSDLSSEDDGGAVSPVVNYVVITPARNEEANIGETIVSMCRQTIVPSAWYIVDDGSTDDTASIVTKAAVDAPWIHLVSRDDRGFRSAGGGVVQAFKSGYRQLGDSAWDYLAKLDADLRFSNDYFASCFQAFEHDRRLGIAGGTIYNLDGDRRIAERHPTFHVRGATKIYRRACWEEIGGLVGAPGWDTIDELSANMHGWTTRTLSEVPIDQLRTTGDAAGQWRNWVKNGSAAYLVGYHPLFLLVRAASRLVRPPYMVGAVGLLWGYTRSVLRREPRAADKELVAYVRTQQMNRLMGRESIWR